MIASDIVLTAKSCGDRTGDILFIGAYEAFNHESEATVRTCKEWIGHPNYFDGLGGFNDVALCKLEVPVTLDESSVRLELNRENVDDFPIEGEDLIDLGFGLLGTGAAPAFLQSTPLDGTTCAGGPYNQVCAFGGGNTCQGDLGGPLVKIVPQTEGPDIHYHVGLVSFNDNVCLFGNVGSYTRTSAMQDWIDEAMCQLNSADAVDCDTAEEECLWDTLLVSVTTDLMASENEWTLEQASSGKYFEVARNNLELSLTQYTDTVCLNPDTEYRWRITDTAGDGLEFPFGPKGSYTLTLNGEEVLPYIPFTTGSTVFFSTDKTCTNLPETMPWYGEGDFLQENPLTCGDIARTEKRRSRKCNESFYREACPGLCAKRCECHDYEYEFRATKTSQNDVTCATLTKNKCKHARVQKNCPTLCDETCDDKVAPEILL